MTTGLFRNLIIARAMSVDPIARALYPDPLDRAGGPFVRAKDRWRKVAGRAALASSPIDVDEPALAADAGR